ncbi:hypothetical protein A2U01_0022495 [Trifolium medium]|uniref:Uncharacterized protein n=1 Tax=Trifolium medium TaxID=97028 RepID=A0A392NQH7_9FABA|nr:hypothetical protein [Trifolium medium]
MKAESLKSEYEAYSVKSEYEAWWMMKSEHEESSVNP